MSVEELNLWWLDESWESKEVSEKEQQKASEDSKWAGQARKQIQDSKQKTMKIALFLSKILGKYYNNAEIINIMHNFLEDIETQEHNLYFIFAPFLWLGEDKFEKINDYVVYLQKNIEKIEKTHINLVLLLIEIEKLGWEEFWKNLKNTKNYTSFLQEIEKNLFNK